MDAETRAVLVRLLAALDAEHQWTGPGRMCWPKDGWPCVTREVADELRALVEREDGDG